MGLIIVQRSKTAICLILMSGFVGMCDGNPLSISTPVPTAQSVSQTQSINKPTTLATDNSSLSVRPVTPSADISPTDIPTLAQCSLGVGLRRETVPILLKYRETPGLVMSASPQIASTVFPELEGWIRAIGAPSLSELEKKAEIANENNIPYEALAYGLETLPTTPTEEWHDLVGSTQKARELSDQFGKSLIMGPGLRLMDENVDAYQPMGAQTDIWVFQTQMIQKGNPPGEEYRKEVERVVEQVKSGNSDIEIWAQITLPPDREPDAQEWLAYRQSIVDLVDGTFIGVYTWSRTDSRLLLNTIDEIFVSACGLQ
jgi:hypothetical protein